MTLRYEEDDYGDRDLLASGLLGGVLERWEEIDVGDSEPPFLGFFFLKRFFWLIESVEGDSEMFFYLFGMVGLLGKKASGRPCESALGESYCGRSSTTYDGQGPSIKNGGFRSGW